MIPFSYVWAVMTGDSCIKEHFTAEDLKEAIVRSNSDYFWKGGSTHKVQNIIENEELKKPYRNIFILQVTPNFPDGTKKPKLVAAPSVARTSCEAGKFIVAGWGGEQDPTEQIRKRKPFAAHQWLPESLMSCKDNLCHKAKAKTKVCCNQAIITNEPEYEQGPVSGKVLVNVRSGSPQLLAMELIHLFKGKDTTEKDLTYFVDIGNPEFIKWLEKVVPESIMPLNEPLNKANTKYILYSQMETSKYIADMKYFARYNPLRKYANE